jgi:hypothetical protein
MNIQSRHPLAVIRHSSYCTRVIDKTILLSTRVIDKTILLSTRVIDKTIYGQQRNQL